MQLDPKEPTWVGRSVELGSTNWSVVLAAGDSSSPRGQEALASLCAAYWLPLYAYVRKRHNDRQRAEDLTQAFFVHLFEKNALNGADPNYGRFRAFLLTSLKNFLSNERDKEHAQKRGGGRIPLSLDFQAGESYASSSAIDTHTPERAFARQWALVMIQSAIDRLATTFAAEGKQQQFDRFLPFLTHNECSESWGEVAAALGMTENSAYVALHRMRMRFREILRKLICDTLENPSDVDDEIRQLFDALGK